MKELWWRYKLHSETWSSWMAVGKSGILSTSSALIQVRDDEPIPAPTHSQYRWRPNYKNGKWSEWIDFPKAMTADNTLIFVDCVVEFR